MLKRVWCEDEGVLTFEWILLTTLLVIGLVGAMSGVRDAINSELADVAQAMVSLDQSYSICSPIDVCVTIPCRDGAVGSSWGDSAAYGIARHDGTSRQGPPTPLNCEQQL